MRKTAIDLIAVQDFTFDGRAYEAGEAFTVTPIEAASLTYRHLARFATTNRALRADLPPAEEPAPTPTRRRRYRRRDLTAEPA